MGREPSYWERKAASRRFTRRGFVGAASAGAFGVAGAALVGCGDDDDDNGGTTATATSTAATSTSTASGTAATATQTQAAGQPVRGGKVRLLRTLDAADFDPTKALTSGLHTHLYAIYNKLVRTVRPSEASGTGDFTLKSDLAESWEDVDLQTYTFKVRQDVNWHNVAPVNGRKFVASDVVKAFEHYAAGGVQASIFAVVDTMETPDDATVVIKLKSPFSGFLATLSHSARHVFAPEVLEREGGLAATPIIGTGPYLFEKFERETIYTAVRNPDYFEEGLPYLDGFEMPLILDSATRVASFRAGDIDTLGASFKSEWDDLKKDNPALVGEINPWPHAIWHTAMDPYVEPWSDPRVRRAISMAYDRQTVVDTIWEGEAISGWGIPWVYGADAPWTDDQLMQWHKFDVAEAKKLMEAAGHGDGLKTTLFYYNYNPGHVAQVQLFQADMKANLNLDISLEQLGDFPAYAARVQGKEYSGLGWGYQGGSDTTLDDFCYKNVHSQGGGNYWRMNDPDIDRIAEAIRLEPDEEGRRELVREMFAIDADMQYRIFQPMPSTFALYNPKFKGWQPSLQFRAGIASGYLTDAWLEA